MFYVRARTKGEMARCIARASAVFLVACAPALFSCCLSEVSDSKGCWDMYSGEGELEQGRVMVMCS